MTVAKRTDKWLEAYWKGFTSVEDPNLVDELEEFLYRRYLKKKGQKDATVHTQGES